MPELIKEMKDDLLVDKQSLVRELFILPNHHVPFNSGGELYFCYYEDEHSNLLQKIKLLEDYGYLNDITHTNVPKYRMNELFVNFVINAEYENKKIKL